MNKFLTKIATAFVGIAMAIGVGVGLNRSGVNTIGVNAETSSVTFDFEDTGAHRASGSNSYTSNTYSENSTNISMTYFDGVSSTKLGGSYNATGRIAKNTTNSPVLKIGPYSTGDWTVTGISFKAFGVSAMKMVFATSTDDSTYTTQTTVNSMPTSYSSGSSGDYSISNLSLTSSTLYLRWTISVSSSTSSSRDCYIDDIVLSLYKDASQVVSSVGTPVAGGSFVKTYSNVTQSSTWSSTGLSADVTLEGGGTYTGSISYNFTPATPFEYVTGESSSLSITATAGGVTSSVALVVNDMTVSAKAGYAPSSAYSVAQARTAIDSGTDITNVYTTGTVYQVDSYNSTYHSITYWISDDGTSTNPLEVYGGLGIDDDTNQFTSVNDVQVGDVVIVYGTLKKYNSTYEYDKDNRLISLNRPSAKTITTTVTNGTYTGSTSIGAGTASVTISPNSGYKLPSTVSVTNATYEYNSSTGVITLSEATGDVTISATCPEATSYAVTITASHCTFSPANPSIYENGEIAITFTADSGYALPASAPTVTGASVKSWEGGVLTLNNPTGAVSFSITATEYVAQKYGEYTGNIVAGQYVIYAAGTYNKTLGNTMNGTRVSNGASVTITSGVISDPDASVVWNFVSNGTGASQYWTIQNVNNNKYLGTTTSNNAGDLGDSASDAKFQWTITYDEDGYHFFNKGASDSTKAYLRNNSGNYWACYNESTGLAPTLYKLNHLPKAWASFNYVDSVPDKTTYMVGETFNPAGLTIKAVFTYPELYEEEDITNEIVWDNLEVGNSVTGTWEGHEVTISGLTITSFTPSTYTKVTALSQIAVGSEVIIGYKGASSSFVLSSFSSKYFTHTSATSTDNSMDTTESAIVWTIEVDSSGYYFRNGANYLNRSGGDNAFGTKDTSNSKLSCWTLSFTDGQFKMANGSYYLKYNTSSPRFKCYESGQADINLYIKQTASETDILKTYVSRYLNPTDGALSDIPSSETGVAGTACLGNDGLYRKAKTAITTGEFASYNSAFQSSVDTIVTNARLRYVSWAKAYGDTTPYASTVTNGSQTLIETIDANTTSIIIVVISMISLTAIGGFFFIKKRKEQ